MKQPRNGAVMWSAFKLVDIPVPVEAQEFDKMYYQMMRMQSPTQAQAIGRALQRLQLSNCL
jgi:hypothetical protein